MLFSVLSVISVSSMLMLFKLSERPAVADHADADALDRQLV